MTWCLPWNLCSKALRDLLGRKTSAIAAPLRGDVLEVMMSYGCEATRKAGNELFFGVGRSKDDEH